MENKNLNDIIGDSSAPYLNLLAKNYGLAIRYTAVTHPSLPNYLALLGGSTFGCDDYDGDPNSNSCTSSAWKSVNLVDRIESVGLNWKAYMEDMPSSCYGSDAGNYAVRHDPFVYFTDIVNNPTRCARVVPANSGGSGLPDDKFINDLGSTSTASNFMWLTPNVCDDMHDCSISEGDNYLSQLVPQILNSYIFTTQKAALFITFDEGKRAYPSDYVYTIWAGPVAKNNYQSSTFYSHYSFLRTLETSWGLSSLTSNDSDASDMMEFFTSPSSSISSTTATTSSTSTTTSTPISEFNDNTILLLVALATVSLVGFRSRRRNVHSRTKPSTKLIAI